MQIFSHADKQTPDFLSDEPPFSPESNPDDAGKPATIAWMAAFPSLAWTIIFGSAGLPGGLWGDFGPAGSAERNGWRGPG